MIISEKKKLDPNKISCIIPTHNRDEFLKDAINSVIEQTQPPIEISVLNNLPNKQTREVVEEFKKKSPIPINYIEHNMNGKGSISYNLGAAKSKGDYVAFLDDDDMWEKNYLEKMSIFISSRKSKITYAWFNKLKNNQKTPYKKLKENLKMHDFLLRNPGSTVSNLIVDRDIFIGMGGFDDYTLSFDKDFLIRAIYFGYNYNVLNEFLVTQRKHAHRQNTDINEDFLLSIKKFFKKHEWIATPSIKMKFWVKYWKMYFKILINNVNKTKI